MTEIAVQVTARCPRCGAAVPINALVQGGVCPGCRVALTLGAQTWTALLGDALAAAASMATGEGRTNPNVWTADGQFTVNFARAQVRCEECKAEADVERLAGLATRGFGACVGCGRRTAVRALPEWARAMLPGVDLVVGEDLDQLAAVGDENARRAREPLVLACQQCGSALAADGSSRLVACKFCQAQNQLPDHLWLRLQPTRAATWWYLRVGGAPARGGVGSAPMPGGEHVWSTPLSAVADHQGNLYMVEYGDDDTVTVSSIETSGYSLRWRQGGVRIPKPCDLVMARGEVLLWNEKRHGAYRFEASSGRPLGEVGWQEPPGSPVRVLDLKRASSFTVDFDGSFVVFILNRVVRYGPDGRAVPMWAGETGGGGFLQRGEDLGPLWKYGVGEVLDDIDDRFYDGKLARLAKPPRGTVQWAKDLSHRPHALTAGFLKGHIGWDGFLYMVDWSDHLLMRYDRAGTLAYKVKLPLEDLEFSRFFHADGAGNAYVMGETKGDRRAIARVSPDGRQVALVKERRVGGPLDPTTKAIAVAPDGRLWAIGERGILHAFSPQGAVIHATAAARAAATRAAGDEDDDD